ncbi:CASP-like protein 1F2 [Spinacia oleracea]|uniref:CASP-like protein n=1 Tax=Spinacia oleracea TaxID=3562 RepID=A0ABM3QW72_SPIOL|nr:CASP-like protein 1F2 [Spinacia oleracea]
MDKVEQQPNSEVAVQKSVSRGFVIAQFVLRILIIVFTVVAVAVMATSGVTLSFFGVKFGAHYYDSSAFKFLMAADIIVGVLALFSMLVSIYFVYRKPSNSTHLYCLFLHDLILTMLMISACGAATSIGYVGMYGQPQSAWFKICDRVGKFCFRMGVSVGFSYATFLCLLALTVMTSYKLRKA